MTKPTYLPPSAPTKSEVVINTPTMRYIASLRSQESRRTMTSTLNCFARELNVSSHKDLEWSSVNADVIRHVINRFYERGLRTQRLNTYLTAIKKCSEKAWSMGLINDRELFEIKEIKGERGYQIKRSRPLNSDEVEKLFEQRASPSYSENILIRDNAMLAIMIGCGLRRAELLGLKFDCFFKKQERWWLKVTGKGNKQRQIPINHRRWPHIERWLKLRSKYVSQPSDDVVWLRIDKTGNISYAPIVDTSTVYRIVVRRFQMMFGHREHASPHDLRRTMATLLHKAEVDVSLIQDLLGHSNVATTFGYIHKEDSELVSAVDRI
ncbi:tyrosine-type recombinase/integrase [Vibrio fluvialis]|nr:tyrosine-type recombinase/integrase [Vibrio fluvialis]